MKNFILLISFILLNSIYTAQTITTVPIITHVTTTGSTNGSIKLINTNGGTSPYTYTWQPGSVVSSSITAKGFGTNTITIKDNIGSTTTYSYNIGYKAQWTSFVGTKQQNDTLLNIGPHTWGTALSKNTLAANTDGWFEMVLSNNTGYNIVGFLDSDANVTNRSDDIDYGISKSLNILHRSINGVTTQLSTWKEGDVFRMERIGSVINYKLNSVTIYSVTNTTFATKNIKVKSAVFLTAGSPIVNIGCSFVESAAPLFDGYIKTVPVITHVTTTGGTNGSIKLINTNGGTSSYTYTWQPGSVVSSSITAKGFGTNTITIKDNIGSTTTYSYNIGYKAQWTSFAGAKQQNDTLLNTGPHTWGTALSKNTLAANTDGWFEMVLSNNTGYNIVGFLDSDVNVVNRSDDIDYGIYKNLNALHRSINGVFTYLTSWKEGDVFRMERIGSVINYKLNSVTIYSVTNTTFATKNIKVKSAVFLTGSPIVNIGCSFVESAAPLFDGYIKTVPVITHVTTTGSTNGSIKLINTNGGTSPYTYTWQPGSVVSSSITAKGFGTNTITIKDNIGSTTTYSYNIGYKAQWTSFAGAKQQNDTLLNTGPYSWGTALSKNTLAANTDGWFEMVLSNNTGYNIVGFLDSDVNVVNRYDDIDYGIYKNLNVLHSSINGVQTRLGTWKEGDVFRMERIGSVINYKLNSVTIYSVTNTIFATKNIKVKSAVFLTGSPIANIGCSFDYDIANAVSVNAINYNNESNKGQIQVDVSNLVKPYQLAWNGFKLPTNQAYYADYIANFPSIVIDTVALYHQLDSIRQYPNLTQLEPGNYSSKIYDSTNDSLMFKTVIGKDFSWISSGVSTTTMVIPPTTNSGIKTYYGIGQQVTKNTPTVTPSYAVSDVVCNATNGNIYTEFAINNSADVMDVGFKTASSVNDNLVNDMRYNTYIHFTGNETVPPLMQVYFNDTLISSSTYTTSDVIAIELDTTTKTLSYYKNGTSFLTKAKGSSTMFSNNLQLKIALKTAGASLKYGIINGGGIIKFNTQDILATITDITCSTLNTGVIKFNAFSISMFDQLCNYTVTGPNGYTSSGTLSFPFTYLNNLSAGTYVINVPIYNSTTGGCSGLPSTTMSKMVKVAYMPDWVNVTSNITVFSSDRTLSRPVSSSIWDGGASSANILYTSSNTEWLEWSFTGKGNSMVGLSSSDPDQNVTSIDYGIYNKVQSGIYNYYIYVGGSSTLFFGNYNPSDIFRMEKTGNVITYYKNGISIGPSSVVSSTDLIVDASLKLKGDIYKPRISFPCARPQQYAVLKKQLDANFFQTTSGYLAFKFDEEYVNNGVGLEYKIYDKFRNVVISNINAPLMPVYKDNRFLLNLFAVAPLTNGYYVLEVKDKKGDLFLLRFKI